MNMQRTAGLAEGDSVLSAHLAERDPAPMLVEVTRGGMVESIHRGIVSVVDAKGKTVKALGDVSRPVYARSAIKPLQAIPVVESGAADAFGLSAAELTLCCASHRGEPMHVDTVTAWLDRLGLSPEDLECGPQMPGHAPTVEAMIRDGVEPTRAHNNCSGKHSGMLTTARHLGEPIAGYSEPDHPVQERLIDLIAELGEVDLSNEPRGRDGCGIPVFGAPLSALALAMAKLADPSGLSADRQAATKRIVEACAENPLMISGTGSFNSTTLAETGSRCLLKGGAEGVYAAAIPSLGLGVCLKIDDGSGRGSNAAMLAVLQSLGILGDDVPDDILAAVPRKVRNWAGTLVGEIRPAPIF